jgi:hypothetical protein
MKWIMFKRRVVKISNGSFSLPQTSARNETFGSEDTNNCQKLVDSRIAVGQITLPPNCLGLQKALHKRNCFAILQCFHYAYDVA